MRQLALELALKLTLELTLKLTLELTLKLTGREGEGVEWRSGWLSSVSGQHGCGQRGLGERVGGVSQLGAAGRHDQEVPQGPGQALPLGNVDGEHDLLGLGLLALHHLVVDLMEVDLAHSLHRVLNGESHKAKSPMSVGLFVVHEHGILDLKSLSG